MPTQSPPHLLRGARLNARSPERESHRVAQRNDSREPNGISGGANPWQWFESGLNQLTDRDGQADAAAVLMHLARGARARLAALAVRRSGVFSTR